MLALVGAITLVGVLLRMRSFGNSLFGDEASSYYIVGFHNPGGILHLLDGHSVDLTPPLYFLASWVVARLGSSVQLLRLVSLLAGVAAIPLTYLVGVRTVGRRGALAAGGFMALDPFLIFYSTEARAYALVTALAVGSTLALLNALDSRRTRWWAAYAACSCAAMYTHYTAVFVLAAQALWALWRQPAARRAVVGANLVAAACFAPWLPALVKNTHSFGTRVFGIIEPFGAHAVARDLAHLAVGHPYMTLATEPGPVAVVLVILGALVGVFGWALASRRAGATGWGRAGRQTGSPQPLLAVLLMLATPAGLVLYSLLREDVWDTRNVIASWPGLALSAGLLLTRSGRRVDLLAVGLVTAGLAIGAVKLQQPRYERPDYRAAVALAVRAGSPAGPVAFIPAPTPGPLSAVDAAFAYAGERRRTLLRIGSATLAATLAAPPYAFLPAVPPATLAAQAARVGHGGKLFVIVPGAVPLAALLGSGRVDAGPALGPWFGAGTTGRLFGGVFVPLSSFLKAALRDFRPAGEMTFNGFLALSEYVFVRR